MFNTCETKNQREGLNKTVRGREEGKKRDRERDKEKLEK